MPETLSHFEACQCTRKYNSWIKYNRLQKIKITFILPIDIVKFLDDIYKCSMLQVSFSFLNP